MDPFNAALLSGGTFLAGIIVKWAIEKFLARHDRNETEAAEKAAEVERLQRNEEFLRVEHKIDKMLASIDQLRSSFDSTVTELRERINGISSDHGGRIRRLEAFAVEIRTRLKLQQHDEEEREG